MQSWIEVLVVSMMPVSELRGGIPLGLMLGLNPAETYLIAVAGNFIPVPFLLWLLDKVGKIVERWGLTAKLYSKIVERTERRKTIVERYGYLGLVLFVAIPLPMTGAWTGTLLAFLLRLSPVRAAFSILSGVLIAGVVVTAVSFTGVSLVRWPF